MKEIEQEKYFQAIYEKELEDLHSKHANKMNNGSDAGFLRYKNSHSHIPPLNNSTNNEMLEEIKQTEPQIDYKHINDNTFDNNNNQIKCLQIQLLKERLAWQRKMYEQELELQNLKLQMLQQQNDQKTTLKYLLKLQTDFTQQIANHNQDNNINIRKPLPLPLSAIINGERASPIQYNNNVVNNSLQNHNISAVHCRQHTSQPQSNYYPIQQMRSNNSNQCSNNCFYHQTQHPFSTILPATTHSSINASPIQHIVSNNNSFYDQTQNQISEQQYEEQKQDSILVCVDDNDINDVLLDTKTSFLIINDCEISDEDNVDFKNNNKQLNKSINELNSHSTTIYNNVINNNKKIEYSNENENEIDGTNEEMFELSYSSFDNIDNKIDDELKQISDIDINSVESVRQCSVYSEKIDDNIPIETPNTSMTQETFVVKYAQSKQNEEENESEIQLNDKDKKDISILPELDASINNFKSIVYSVYSSIDDTLKTNSDMNTSDVSNGTPRKVTCNIIIE
eukprot:366751_1